MMFLAFGRFDRVDKDRKRRHRVEFSHAGLSRRINALAHDVAELADGDFDDLRGREDPRPIEDIAWEEGVPLPKTHEPQ